MYSRYHNRNERPVTLPENYSGIAFSNQRPPREEPPAPLPHRIDVAKPTPPPEPPTNAQGMPPPPRPILLPPPSEHNTPREASPPSEVISTQPPPCENEKKESKAAPAAFLQPLQGLFGNVGHAFPFSHGFGFDEILIIGLIILLSNNGQDNDLVLWLALLLFCG